MMATTASPKSQVRAYSAGATPTVNVPGRRGGTGVGPVAVWEFRGVTVAWLITIVLSPMCMSCRPGPLAPSWSSQAATAAFSLGEMALYGNPLHGLSQGMSYGARYVPPGASVAV